MKFYKSAGNLKRKTAWKLPPPSGSNGQIILSRYDYLPIPWVGGNDQYLFIYTSGLDQYIRFGYRGQNVIVNLRLTLT
jgi:hypothetical protein